MLNVQVPAITSQVIICHSHALCIGHTHFHKACTAFDCADFGIAWNKFYIDIIYVCKNSAYKLIGTMPLLFDVLYVCGN
jgi:hypothetical protein